ncbi:MAG TPA: HDIG domain-containing protein [Armatimonadetes bacterium]|nr:HDIG domain-containing protein [Armatimonadota bacterium]
MKREEAWQLLTEYTQNEGLRKHALAVEACLRAYARKFGEDEEKWGITGLLHDFDYEQHPSPEEHPLWGSRILRERGYPGEVIYAILSHADYLQDQYPRRNLLDKALYAVDELTGFVTAVALVRPNKDLREVTVKSVKKKFKQKAFAAKVDREAIFRGAEELGVDLDEHIALVIEAMQGIAEELGLAGSSKSG